ncbi:GxxExxY protein [Spirosoma profusum]|uniref:GxxExxY protein n=1 Tax=Spirosoma profusum TaxID=2771354 RepID=UPI00293BBFE7|nr:GxxExxY protein [Spirosoma profusum]
MQQEYKYGELTHRIIGCSMEVHRVLGSGFQEVIYQRSLAYELEQFNIGFASEVDMPIFYKGVSVGARRADFLIEENVLVELKAIIKLEEVHLAQAIN